MNNANWLYWLKDKRRQIESNDPELDKLIVGSYYPHDGDWEMDGKLIGKNTNIKELCFGNNLAQNNVSRNDFEAFCRGFSGNESIERLRIECSTLFGGEIFNMLSPFLEQNSNLWCLSIGYGGLNNSPNSIRLLSELLSRFHTLREFNCRYCKLDDSNIVTLIRALAGHCGLTKFDLTENKVGVRALAALSALLNNPNSSLTDLILAQCSLDDEGAGILAPVVGSSGTLRKLNLSGNGNITITGWRALFTQMQSHQSSLENLPLWKNSIDNAAANLLATALANGSINLEVLNLGEISSITTEGWRALSSALQSPKCMLQKLYLYNNNFNDDDVTSLANCLVFNGILKHLDLAYNRGVTSSGWRAFFAVLQNHSALEKLHLGGNSINDDVLTSFGNSLMHNNKLKELFIGDRNVTSTGWDALSNVLCNKSSIEETFNSNHTLGRVLDPFYYDGIDESDLPYDLHLRALLQLNHENTKMESARRKILQVHFSGGNFTMQPFIDMDLKTLPHAVAWMARDEHGSSLLYQFVRNTTLFIDVHVGDGGSTSENEPKPKRQKM